MIGDRKTEVADETARVAALQAQIDRTTAAEAGSDGRIAEQQGRADAVREAAGLVALHGPGLRVVLNDAPRRPDGALPAGARPDDVVVHQQDVQSVVNALWAGGAEAMVIMGAAGDLHQRRALRRQHAAPARPGLLAPVRDQRDRQCRRMRTALDTAPGVRAFRDAAALSTSAIRSTAGRTRRPGVYRPRHARPRHRGRIGSPRR